MEGAPTMVNTLRDAFSARLNKRSAPARPIRSASSEPILALMEGADMDDPMLRDAQWVRYPPGVSNVFIPLTSRGGASAGVCLYPASRWTGLLGQWATYTAIRVLGPRALPGKRYSWSPPTDASVWRKLRAEWDAALGPVDEIAVYERLQSTRSGVGLMLLSGGRPLAFVKVQETGEALRRERELLELLADVELPGVFVPRVVASGVVADWEWLALTPLPTGPHRPARGIDPEGFSAALSDALLPVLARPDGIPTDWQPMHGDLTPWNVRRVRDGRLCLLDWESADWGPPGADAAYYRCVAAVIYGDPPGRASRDVVEHWSSVLSQRLESEPDAHLNTRMAAVLQQMVD